MAIVVTSPTYISFLLRLWCEPERDSTSPAGWRGEIEHIQSGRRTQFTDMESLNAYLHSQTDAPGQTPGRCPAQPTQGG